MEGECSYILQEEELAACREEISRGIFRCKLKISSGMFGRNVPRYLRGVTVQWWCVERMTAA